MEPLFYLAARRLVRRLELPVVAETPRALHGALTSNRPRLLAALDGYFSEAGGVRQTGLTRRNLALTSILAGFAAELDRHTHALLPPALRAESSMSFSNRVDELADGVRLDIINAGLDVHQLNSRHENDPAINWSDLVVHAASDGAGTRPERYVTACLERNVPLRLVLGIHTAETHKSHVQMLAHIAAGRARVMLVGAGWCRTVGQSILIDGTSMQLPTRRERTKVARGVVLPEGLRVQIAETQGWAAIIKRLQFVLPGFAVRPWRHLCTGEPIVLRDEGQLHAYLSGWEYLHTTILRHDERGLRIALHYQPEKLARWSMGSSTLLFAGRMRLHRDVLLLDREGMERASEHVSMPYRPMSERDFCGAISDWADNKLNVAIVNNVRNIADV